MVKKLVCLLISTIALLTPLQRQELGKATVFTQADNVFLSEYKQTKIAAHRSGKGIAPENTLAAVKECVKADGYKLDMIEIDVQLTRDNELVLFHDIYLDDDSDSAEYFSKEKVTVFSKDYEELRALNLGENFKRNGEYPYRGLRGDDIPDDLRILRLEDMFSYLESEGRLYDFIYSIEIKYPHPWAPKMLKEVYRIVEENDLSENVIIGSFWPDVILYFDRHYGGKMHRYAGMFEILDLYRSYYLKEDLSNKDFGYIAMSLPYYEDDGKQLVANLGISGFIDYAHKYGIAMHYWTVDSKTDAEALRDAGADLLMCDNPQNVYNYVHGS
jgi:glycerophosphoryl diester phosphodiesterase